MITYETPGTKVYIDSTRQYEAKDIFTSFYEQVSPRRKKSIDRKRFLKDKLLALGVEVLLMQACKDFEVDYAKEPIVLDRFNKPGFAKVPLFFNLSHSEQRVMCIMSKYPVGCDVEKLGSDDLSIAEHFFHASEYQALKKCTSKEERKSSFLRLWTLKESFLKCTGLGISLPLESFAIDLASRDIKVIQSIDNAHYCFFEKDLQDGYRYAWCVKK